MRLGRWKVLKRLPEARQTLLFSATLPGQLVEFARAGLSQPVLGHPHSHSASSASPPHAIHLLQFAWTWIPK